MEKFKLSKTFLEQYSAKQPKWGPLGYVTYKRSYARQISKEHRTEEYWETLERVTNGVYSIQKIHARNLRLPWNDQKSQKSAQTMFRLMWEFKFLPPGRGLFQSGTDFVYERGSASLQNCGVISTNELDTDFAYPFAWMMDMLMLGVGVSGDTEGAGKVTIQFPEQSDDPFIIEDSREGWVNALTMVLESFINKQKLRSLDASLVRPKGSPINGFGGLASGPGPLLNTLSDIILILHPKKNGNAPYKLRSDQIVDIFNLIGRCVVAGGVRRTAELMLGDPNDDVFLKLKQNKEKLKSHRWASNNSVVGTVGMDYTKIAEAAAINGEPGILYIENARQYGRMIDPPNFKDRRIVNFNPCVSGNTLIAVADGRNAVKIKDLVGTQYPVYSNKNGKVIIKKAIKTWKTQENTKIWKLTLDDDSYLLATPDNQNMLRNGKYKELKDLQIGESLMPFNSYISNEHYRQIASNTGRDRRQYRMIAEHNDLIVDPKNTHIHHEDYNSFNDRIENLKAMDKNKHIELHRKRMIENNPMFDPLIAKKVGETIRRNGSSAGKNNPNYGGKSFNEEVKRKIGKESKENWKNQKEYMIESIRNGMTDEVKKHLSEDRKGKIKSGYLIPIPGKRGWMKNPLYNHKVKSVEFYGYEDVYDITVEDTHNFGIITKKYDENAIHSTGIFIHNCGEQPLESGEMCTLCETFPSNHDKLSDWVETLKFAYLYAKSITLLTSHNERTNAIMARNRRIGLSISGIIDAFNKFGRRNMLNAMDEGYKKVTDWDQVYSDWLAIPRSIKKTTVKPSGTVSLLAGVSPGIHYPHSEYYIRRIRMRDDSPLLKILKDAKYKIENDYYSPNTKVIEFPIHEKYFIKGKNEISIWEQVKNAVDLQYYWSDNSVSITVTVKEKEKKDIKTVLEAHEDSLKSISFLPLNDHGYEQPPYEEIDKTIYKKLNSKIKPLNYKKLNGNGTVHDFDEKFCTNDSCEIKIPTED